MDHHAMSRAFRLLFWFLVGVGLSAVIVPAFAATNVPVPIPGVSVDPTSGLLISTARSGVQSVVYPALNTTTPVDIPVAGVQPGHFLMPIPTQITPNAARVAGAVMAIARISGPIGLGLNILGIVCSTTDICASTSDPNSLSKRVPNYIYYINNTSTLVHYESADAACAAASGGSGSMEYGTGTLQVTDYVNLGICRYPSGYPMYGAAASQVSGYVGATPTYSDIVPTEADFTAAVAALTAATSRMGDLVAAMNAQGIPVPIDKPVLSPASVTGDPQTTINRDQAGNVINTTTSTTTVNVNPVTDNSTTNNVTVQTVTNTTTTNSTGVVTGSSSTSADAPPPDDPTVSFDDVPDVPLQNQELPLSLSPSSWGEGTCPADPSVSVLGHPVTVPVHVVCDYMVGVRGAVIAMFALIAAYIVVGVKFEG